MNEEIKIDILYVFKVKDGMVKIFLFDLLSKEVPINQIKKMEKQLQSL